MPDTIIEVDQHALRIASEIICTECRYPLLALRIFIHVLCGINEYGHISISARHLAKKLDVNYDTVTKCLKFLRENGLITREYAK
ncbi:MAG: MarR family transcriptional regulator [Chitinophagales bacterium]|nr:MarR family transcriptional regulator [Chitinophagales bacterium]